MSKSYLYVEIVEGGVGRTTSFHWKKVSIDSSHTFQRSMILGLARLLFFGDSSSLPLGVRSESWPDDYQARQPDLEATGCSELIRDREVEGVIFYFPTSFVAEILQSLWGANETFSCTM